ncbi:MAG: cytochrome c peroxidase [Pseudomonadota bacterium]
MTSRTFKLVALFAVAAIVWAAWQLRPASYPEWSENDLAVLKSMSLTALPPLPDDPSNAVADDPRAATMGQQLFNDPRMSANGLISCATCHQAIRNFTDGLPQGQALGTAARNTPSIAGTAYSPWQYWDGRRDSQWSQALSPLEDANEHGVDRTQVVEFVASDPGYREQYEALFGELDAAAVNATFANIGKAIAAFERTVMPGRSRFDDYVDDLAAGGAGEAFLEADEAQGLQLFIGEANCTQCHNGPLLTNNEFHNTGVINFPGQLPDKGRADGVREVLANEFNCKGAYNDDPARTCAELEFVRTGPDLLGAFKTPSLRNLENTQPYMHKGQLADLAAVLEHYNNAPDAMIGHNEAKPLGLSSRELRQLEAFLGSLAAPVKIGH